MQVLSRLKGLVHLEWQWRLVSPQPTALQALASLSCLRSLSLSINDDDPVARVGLHCLPPSITSLTLHNISLAPPPISRPHPLPLLCHLHLKSTVLPSLAIFASAPAVEWLSLDSCDVPIYLSDLTSLWPSLSWLEISYQHEDWHLLHSSTDLLGLACLTRLRKLSLCTPFEECLTTDSLLALTQLRLLSISPSPTLNHSELMRLSQKLCFLAGLELKLYRCEEDTTDEGWASPGRVCARIGRQHFLTLRTPLLPDQRSDVPHHAYMIEQASAMHASLQESLPMTDVLIMVCLTLLPNAALELLP